MVGLTKEPVYVTYTCKNPQCRKAFIDLDPYDNINDEPLTTRYCPECVKNGFSNDGAKKNITKEESREVYVKTKIKEMGIKNPKEKRFLISYCKKQVKYKTSVGARVVISNIFKDALEVLSYQSWKS